MAPQQCGPHVGEHRQSFSDEMASDGIGPVPGSAKDDLLEEHSELLSLDSSSCGPNLDHLRELRVFSALVSLPSGYSTDQNMATAAVP